MKRKALFFLIALCFALTGCLLETPQEHYARLKEGEKTGFYAEMEVSCKTILNNLDSLDASLKDYIPPGGVIVKKTVEIRKNDTVLKLLSDTLTEDKILYVVNSGYVYSIAHIREKCCTPESGWVVKVNGVFLKSGAGSVYVQSGDRIEWLFSCVKGDVYDGL